MGAIALERGDTRVILCGVDIVGIDAPEIGPLIARVAAATGAAPEGILLNWSHTHLAPTGGRLHGAIFGELDDDAQFAVDAFARVIQDKIVSVAQLAVERLEPARVVWGQGVADVAVNRRERTPDGLNGGSILGWNPDELVDIEVTTLQARRPDESVIATLVGYGCHPVTTGLRHVRLLRRLPGPAAPRRPRRPRAASASSSRARAATSCRGSRSPTTRPRPSGWARGSPSRRSSRSPTGWRRPSSSCGSTRAR